MYAESIIEKSAFNLATSEVVCITEGDFSCAESSYRENSLHRRLCMTFHVRSQGTCYGFLDESRITAAPSIECVYYEEASIRACNVGGSMYD